MGEGRTIRLPDPTPSFTAMMEFVCEKFSEARATATQDCAPMLPGMQPGEAPVTTPRFNRVQPINFFMPR